jgi:threonyl-tRNA synthetase
VRLLPVTSAHESHVASLVDRLAKDGFRVDSVAADEQLGKRIRAAKLERIPYVLVVGDDDVKAGTVGVNPRGGEVQRDTPFDAFVARLRADVHEGAGR